MAENTTATEELQHLDGTSKLVKSQTSTVGGNIAIKPHTLKHTGSLVGGSIGLANNNNNKTNNNSTINNNNNNKNSGITSDIGKHHHHHHHHHHHSHSSHHNSPHVIHRTTSESLRLGSDILTGSVSGNNSNSNIGSSSISSSSSLSAGGCSTAATNNTSSSSSINSINSNPQLLLNAPGQRKPKTSSFQITSVTVGNKLSADNGEDSADDLDESHTDDNSRITDIENETPSFSEDTFSKEDVFFSSNAIGTAPVIPTSSQYGLVIVDSDLGGVGGTTGQNLTNVHHVSVTDAGINIVGSGSNKLNEGDQKDMQHRNERFKVVKIESTEPFKRGRWMCMDYLDHTTLQQPQQQQQQQQQNTDISTTNTSTTQGNATTNDSGVVISENHIDTGEPPDSNASTNVMIGPTSINSSSPGETLQHPVSLVDHQQAQQQIVQQQQQPGVNPSGGVVPSVMHAQTMTHVPNVVPVSVQQQNIAGQSLQSAQLQQAVGGHIQTQQPQNTQTDFQQQQQQQPITGNLQGQSQPAHFYINNQQQPQQQQQQQTHMHGVTLPTNIVMQNGVPTNLLPQTTSQSHGQPQSSNIAAMNIPMSNVPSSIPEHIVVGNVTTSIPQQAPPQQSISQPQTGGIMQQQVIQQSHSAPQTQIGGAERFVSQQSVPQTFGGPPPISTGTNVNTNTGLPQDMIQQIDIGTTMPSQTINSGIVSPASGGNSQIGGLSQNDPNGMQQSTQQQQQPQNISIIQDTNSTTIPTMSGGDSITAAATAIQAQQQNQAGQQQSANTLQTQQSVVANDDNQQTPMEADNESASGTSAVAIDNKIEQAMDLVKSHLMIAVREEVEVLKEKIAELMDRINQLELENTILKANVSQETLSQLSATLQTATTKPPQNTNPSNGPGS